jgi:hypothetical protein
MVALILTLIIIIATTAHFYLKLKPMQSFGFVISAIIGLTTAFSYYEVAADLLISKGYMPQVAQFLVLLLIFGVVTFALQYLSSFIVGSNIDFGRPATVATAIICGIITSLVISGVVIVAIGLAPLRKSFPYSRFGDTINVTNSSSALIPADSFVVGLYNVISNGALSLSSSSSNRFDVVHANYLDQIHLNRYAVTDGASIVAAKEAAFVEKFDVTKLETPDGESYTRIVLSVRGSEIKDGGAKDSNNKVSFTPAQVRVLCVKDGKNEITGDDIKVIYPSALSNMNDEEKEIFQLSNVTVFDRKEFVKTSRGSSGAMPLPFQVPQGYTAKYLQFKANGIFQLPKSLTKEEKEAAEEEQANNTPPDATE